MVCAYCSALPRWSAKNEEGRVSERGCFVGCIERHKWHISVKEVGRGHGEDVAVDNLVCWIPAVLEAEVSDTSFISFDSAKP